MYIFIVNLMFSLLIMFVIGQQEAVMITKRKENPYLNIYLIYSLEGQQEGGNIYNLEGHQGVGIYSIEIHHDGEMVLRAAGRGKYIILRVTRQWKY